MKLLTYLTFAFAYTEKTFLLKNLVRYRYENNFVRPSK